MFNSFMELSLYDYGVIMIIFNGKDICVHYNEGHTDFLLITFMGIGHETAWENQYFAKPFVENQNISCLGIVSKERNWYVTDEIQNVFAIIDAVRATYKKIITIGLSAGGVCCIKILCLFKVRCNYSYGSSIIH